MVSRAGRGWFDSFRLRGPVVIRTQDGLVSGYGSAREIGGAWHEPSQCGRSWPFAGRLIAII